MKNLNPNSIIRQSTFKKPTTGNSHKHISKIAENYSNENMFRNETDYRMKQDLKFEQDSEELNCNKNVFMRFIDLLNIATFFLVATNFGNIFHDWGNRSFIIIICRILILILSTFNLFIVSNIDKFITNTNYLRLFLEFNTILSFTVTLDRFEITNINIPVNFFHCFIFNLIFTTSLKRSLSFYIVETIMVLIFTKKECDDCFFSEIFENIFSTKFLYVLSIISLYIFAEYLISKAIREIWAMYDSFKRSFFTMKNICDDLPFPTFLINIKKTNSCVNLNNTNFHFNYQIYYKNQEAEKLLMKIKRIKEKSNQSISKHHSVFKTQKVDINFKELFDKQVEKLFDSEIEKCLLNDIKYFDFPLIIGEAKFNYKQNLNFPTLFEGDLESIKFVRIIVNPTSWKGSDCVMIQIMENEDLQHHYIMEKYRSSINKDEMILLDNIDILCDKAPDMNIKPKESLTIKSPLLTHSRNINQLQNKSGSDTPVLLRSPSLSGQTFILKSPVSLKPFQSPQDNLIATRNFFSPTKVGNILRVTGNVNEVTSDKSKGNLDQTTFVIPNNQITYNFDYATFFLFKNSYNYLYDMNLTLDILNSLRMNKIKQKLTKFHFENYLKYLISYFMPILKLKNFKIEFNSEIDGEVNAVLDYYRCLFFNAILFILNNSKTKNVEQTLSINVVFTRFSDEGSSYYEVTFGLKDDDPKIPYNILVDYLNLLKKTELRNMDYNKYKIMDIGLVTSHYIVNIVYNSEFRINTIDNEHKFSFLIFNYGGSEELKDIVIKNYTLRNYENEEKYYNRIIEKLYKVKKEMAYKGIMRSHSSRRNTAYKNEEEDDKFDTEEDKNYSLVQDWESYKDIHLMINNNYGSDDKILLTKPALAKLLEIKEKSEKLKIKKEPETILNKFTAIWDNTSTINNIKYCPIPRFLIVEDNIVGRMSIKDELKRLRLEHRHDIAADGREAVDKFKILLNQGYIFDFIFMDIYLPEMGGVEATKAIRNIESSYNVHSNIVAVTVEGKKDLEEGIFDEYFEKPIKNSDKFFSYISKHFKNNRPEITFKDFK